MATTPKTAQLQVRVSSAQKARIESEAKSAGMDISAWVLSRLLPPSSREFQTQLGRLHATEERPQFVLAELNSFLSSLSAPELVAATSSKPGLPDSPFLRSYVAAMVEYACSLAGIGSPKWTMEISPLIEPYFGSSLLSLRLYLLSHSPAPFRRRNIFIDASVGNSV
jgi:hypothetical protein